MKTYLPFFYGALFIFLNCSNEQKTKETSNNTETANSNAPDETSSIIGQWKKTAYGQDLNKNGILDDSEREKAAEDGAFDNMNFYAGGRFMYSGIVGEMKGDYLVKTINGKKMILLMEDDPEFADMSREEREQDATKFEIKSMGSKQMILVPPIYLFVLVIYTKVS